MFAVRPAIQGAGIGRAVLAEAERLAREWGCDEMRMSVIRQRTDLIAWYRRLGFEPTGETQPFPSGRTWSGTTLARYSGAYPEPMGQPFRENAPRD
jgi:L-amino acid N-acyltransferase YncA